MSGSTLITKPLIDLREERCLSCLLFSFSSNGCLGAEAQDLTVRDDATLGNCRPVVELLWSLGDKHFAAGLVFRLKRMRLTSAKLAIGEMRNFVGVTSLSRLLSLMPLTLLSLRWRRGIKEESIAGADEDVAEFEGVGLRKENESRFMVSVFIRILTEESPSFGWLNVLFFLPL